jgi:exodeoxyribonuclease V alpha subunit
VHRLIGAVPGGRLPRYGRERRRVADVVVIDEASMVDLALMARLLDALPETARLVLLGDRDQLASVEAGAVLGDVCAAADAPGSSLAGRVVYLTHSFRFSEEGGIGRLAAAIRAGRVEDALAALRAADPESELDEARELSAPLATVLQDGYRDYLDALSPDALDEAGAKAALDAFDRFRVLCAVKDGPRGVAAVNRRAEELFRGPLGIPRRGAWYRGRPVLVARNEPTLALSNGDVGVCVPVRGEDDAVDLRVAFRERHDDVRLLSPGRLPAHETCWAMTVHKSQGSELDRVALVLPDLVQGRPSPVATRELVYTGITRARSRVDVFAAEDALRSAVATPTRRASGLREALAEADHRNR